MDSSNPALLLNEVQKQHRQLDEQAETTGARAQTMEAQQKLITDLMARVQRLEQLLSSVARRAPERLLP